MDRAESAGPPDPPNDMPHSVPSDFPNPPGVIDAEHAVFVYGTLKKGFRNHKRLKRKRLIGVPGTALGLQLRESGGQSYPFAVLGEGVVHGEVYRVDEKTLEELDVLEGHPDWFHREPIEVLLATGETVIAWVYLNEAGYDFDLIPDGIWRGRRHRRRRSRNHL